MSTQLNETTPYRPATNPNEHQSPIRETPVDSDVPGEDLCTTESYGARGVTRWYVSVQEFCHVPISMLPACEILLLTSRDGYQ